MQTPTRPTPAQVTDAITYTRQALGADLQPLTGGPGYVIRPDGNTRGSALVFPSFAACRAWLLRHRQGLVTLTTPNTLTN